MLVVALVPQPEGRRSCYHGFAGARTWKESRGSIISEVKIRTLFGKWREKRAERARKA